MNELYHTHIALGIGWIVLILYAVAVEHRFSKIPDILDEFHNRICDLEDKLSEIEKKREEELVVIKREIDDGHETLERKMAELGK